MNAAYFLMLTALPLVAGNTLTSLHGSMSGVANHPENKPVVWVAKKAASAPVIDGTIDNVWSKATVCEVTIRQAFGGGDAFVVRLKALYTADSLFVLAQWNDDTKSDMRDPFVWNEEKKVYERPTKPDDQFALQFPISGDFDISMLAMDKDYTTDVWHWKAGRGNSMGFVDDKQHIISKTAVKDSREYNMGNRGKVFIARLMDEGTPAYVAKETPKEFAGKILDSFDHRAPSGSVADVRGSGVYNGTGWTLEMCRRLNTSHPDDAVIAVNKDNTCAIAVLNDELYWNHSVSQIITLRFEK